MTLNKSYSFSEPKFPHRHLHTYVPGRVIKELKRMIHKEVLSTCNGTFEDEGNNEGERKQKIELK